jgi:hypothetical protein
MRGPGRGLWFTRWWLPADRVLAPDSESPYRGQHIDWVVFALVFRLWMPVVVAAESNRFQLLRLTFSGTLKLVQPDRWTEYGDFARKNGDS